MVIHHNVLIYISFYTLKAPHCDKSYPFLAPWRSHYIVLCKRAFYKHLHGADWHKMPWWLLGKFWRVSWGWAIQWVNYAVNPSQNVLCQGSGQRHFQGTLGQAEPGDPLDSKEFLWKFQCPGHQQKWNGREKVPRGNPAFLIDLGQW